MKNGVKNSLTHETCFLNVLVTWTETLCIVPRTIFYAHPVKLMVERCALNGTTGTNWPACFSICSYLAR